jgi:carbon monoxide dehydrogenase subunit G
MRVVCHKEINCTPEHLWSFLAEPDQQKRWMKGLLENARTGPGPDGVGSTFRLKIKEGRRVQEYDGETVAFDPPRHLAVRFWGGAFKEGMVMRVDYRLTPLDGRTRLDYVAELEAGCRLGLFLRLLLPLIKLFGKMQLRGFLKTLQRLAEEAPDVSTAGGR